MDGATVRYLGIAEEEAYGTEVTDTDSFAYTDAETAGLDTPGDVALMYEGISKRAPQVVARAPYLPEGDLDMPLDAYIVGFFLKWALGSYYRFEQLETGANVFRHTFRPANTLDSFTTIIGKDAILEHAFTGCKVNSLEINMNRGEIGKLRASVLAKTDKKNAAKSQTSIDLETLEYFSFSQAGVTIGGSSASVKNCTLTINNNLLGDEGVLLGSVTRQSIVAGKSDISGTLDLEFASTTQMEAFWGGSTGPTQISSRAVVLTLTGSTAGGSTAYSLIITLPAVIFNEIKQTPSGRNPITQTISFTALYDDTSGYQIDAKLVNTREVYGLDLHFRGISAASTSVVMAGGATSGKNLIYYTSNGGTDWTDQDLNYNVRINDISMASTTVGWAVGDDGTIYYTNDAGTTWTAQTSGVTADLHGVYAASASVVIAVGDGGIILGTSNGGTSWVTKTSGVTDDLRSVDGKDALYMACCGLGGALLTSTDGGDTWTDRTTGVTDDLLSISYEFDDPNLHIWAVGEDGTIVHCSDGGVTISEQTSGTTDDLYGVDFFDYLNGIAVGSGGEILRTTNSGATWTKDTYSDTTILLRDISMASATVAWACGANEIILKTTDGGDTWTAQD